MAPNSTGAEAVGAKMVKCNGGAETVECNGGAETVECNGGAETMAPRFLASVCFRSFECLIGRVHKNGLR